MFKRIRAFSYEIWAWFRRRSLFIQILLIFPILCAITVTVLVGNMGLALMGTAVALYAPVVGWVGGLFTVILAKAGIIVAKEHRQHR
ncbi:MULTISPECIES: hypothetical protein [Ruegeria]|uniref:hypothetical protein n=1 Tax=Ruegeria TaxID=97050 RepID=UPI00147C31B3|nr:MULTISPECIES: hypothetical protein [Ruegeria]